MDDLLVKIVRYVTLGEHTTDVVISIVYILSKHLSISERRLGISMYLKAQGPVCIMFRW